MNEERISKAEGAAGNSTDAVIEKIKKCMRLARKAGTDGERQAAEAAAKRMADAHWIALDTISVTDADARATFEKGEKTYIRRGVEDGWISTILRDHFGVTVIQHYRTGDYRMRLSFIGCRINIEVAKYVWDILRRESASAWRDATKKNLRDLRDTAEMAGMVIPFGYKFKTTLKKASFMAGWFYAINEKLTAHPLRNDRDQFEAEKKAMEQEYERYKSEVDGGVKETPSRTGNLNDQSAIMAGIAAGKKVNLSRPCEGRETPSPFALGHTAQLKGGL